MLPNIDTLIDQHILQRREQKDKIQYRLNPWNPITYSTLIMRFFIAYRHKTIKDFFIILKVGWKYS